MVAPLDFQVLLDTMGRFEGQVESCKDRRSLVELFCIQIIPFLQTQTLLDPLKGKWRKKYLELLRQFRLHEQESLREVKEVFFQIINVLEKKAGIIMDKIAHIQQVIAEDPQIGFSSWPLYRVIFKGARIGIDRDEKCRNILEELLDAHEKAGAPEYIIDHLHRQEVCL